MALWVVMIVTVESSERCFESREWGCDVTVDRLGRGARWIRPECEAAGTRSSFRRKCICLGSQCISCGHITMLTVNRSAGAE